MKESETCMLCMQVTCTARVLALTQLLAVQVVQPEAATVIYSAAQANVLPGMQHLLHIATAGCTLLSWSVASHAGKQMFIAFHLSLAKTRAVAV